MIVRIATEGQFELDDSLHDELNRLDNEVVAAVEASDEQAFHAALEKMISLVRQRGRPLDDEHLAGSDLILPPADTTLAEAGEEFTGQGLIPD
jgi:hypothetical protein